MARPTPPDRRSSDAAGSRDVLAASNHRIKRLRRLVSQRKARSDERAFVVEGRALVAEALAGSSSGAIEIEGLYVEPECEPALVAMAEANEIRVHYVGAGSLASALDTVSPQPVAAIVRRAPSELAEMALDALVVVLVDPRDPGNVGTLIRSAEAAGAAGVVLAGTAIDPTNPKVLRAAAGAGLRLPIVVAPDTDRVLDELAASGRTLVATAIDTEAVPYDRIDWSRTAVLLGNETHGLAPDLIGRADVIVTIPFAGPTESLNLGVAGSLICFEAFRQRRADGVGQAGGDPRTAK